MAKNVSAERRRQRQRRHYRVRKQVIGTAARPRLAVFRSNKHIVAQIIDDATGVTVASASTVEKTWDGRGNTVEAATKVGALVADRAKQAGINTVVFDRGGNLYHGRVAALADAARDAGLEF
jgi:large subunit ribosomal protein L18